MAERERFGFVIDSVGTLGRARITLARRDELDGDV
jgi:hypothetical protein